ncbi:hypothetical protein AVEN_100034-1 [Araneus ventricosus]|uniref:Uncharacterized protein n=1 Tax=Araneus ventricosus TaxID=182803 RepID=A0A4Y2NZA7_ARAVE|nr:hypothetical protein AVEN_100034-1 [Araneus ventricosus]
MAKYCGGKKSIVYNVHNLLQIADDVRHYDSLSNFWCYEFENYLGQIKHGRIHVKPLSQLSRRFSEQIFELKPEQNPLRGTSSLDVTGFTTPRYPSVCSPFKCLPSF